MTKEEALALLQAPSAAERLRGARRLRGASLSETELHEVSTRLDAEADAWVRHALASVLLDLEASDPPSMDDSPGAVDERTLREIQAQATEQVTRLFLHELRPIVGSLNSWARTEIPTESFDETRTGIALAKLGDLLGTFSALNEASTAPTVAEFDLTILVGDCAAHQEGFVSFGRTDSVVAVGDQRLISLAITNCLRNAVEATTSSPRSDRPVVANWGTTDSDHWVAILDEGSGLPASSDRLLRAGVTTKKGHGPHFGIGLTIAQRAMHSLGGTVELRPREPVGAVAEIRWPRAPS